MKLLQWVILLLLISLNIQAQDVEKIIKSVQKKYGNVQLLHADFKQINRFKLTKFESEVFGSIWLTQTEKFRLETEDQTIVSDGEKFWRFNKLENQVLIDYAKKSQQDIFLNNFLFNISELYYRQLVGEEKEGKSRIFQIMLTPKDMDNSFFTSVRVWLQNETWELKRVVYTDFNENQVEYIIEKAEVNPPSPGDIFNFNAPEDAEVVDLRF